MEAFKDTLPIVCNGFKGDNIVTIRADLQQGMESVSYFKTNTVTENYWLIYAAATVIWPYHVGIIFSHRVNLKTSTPIPCPVDRDDIVPLTLLLLRHFSWKLLSTACFDYWPKCAHRGIFDWFLLSFWPSWTIPDNAFTSQKWLTHFDL